MTPHEQASFRRFFELTDLAHVDAEEAEALFDALLEVLVWEIRERQSPGKINDRVLDKAAESTIVGMGLLLHLATVDHKFYQLAKRRAARTLVRQHPVPLLYREMAAVLLDSDPPRQKKTYVARDALLILAVAVGQTLGWRPTQAPGKNTTNRSGCARIAELIAPEKANLRYDAIAKVWARRVEKLSAAGFTAENVSELFFTICPMTAKVD